MIELDYETKKIVVINLAYACFMSFIAGLTCGVVIVAASV